MKRMSKGFTLVEIMIVVAIIAILAAVAIPNFIKYRKTAQMNACISNLKQIQAAVEQCKLAGKEVSDANIYGNTGYIKVAPACPATSAAYTLPTDDNDPVCPNPNVANGDGETTYTHALPGSTGAATPAPAEGGGE